MKIELTDDQLEQLEPLFHELMAADEAGIKCAIAAQVYIDGMKVKIICGDRYEALSRELGGNSNISRTSIHEVPD